MKVYLMTVAEQQDFDPAEFTQKLKDAGFKFDSEMCPIKITKPFETRQQPDGSKLWVQWEKDEL